MTALALRCSIPSCCESRECALCLWLVLLMTLISAKCSQRDCTEPCLEHPGRTGAAGEGNCRAFAMHSMLGMAWLWTGVTASPVLLLKSSVRREWRAAKKIYIYTPLEECVCCPPWASWDCKVWWAIKITSLVLGFHQHLLLSGVISACSPSSTCKRAESSLLKALTARGKPG